MTIVSSRSPPQCKGRSETCPYRSVSDMRSASDSRRPTVGAGLRPARALSDPGKPRARVSWRAACGLPVLRNGMRHARFEERRAEDVPPLRRHILLRGGVLHTPLPKAGYPLRGGGSQTRPNRSPHFNRRIIFARRLGRIGAPVGSHTEELGLPLFDS
jgi:hypothetical protein